MSPLLLLVSIPVFVGGVALVALLFAAAVGPRRAFEERPQEGTPADEGVLSRVAPSQHSHTSAA